MRQTEWAGVSLSPGPYFCHYSPECVEEEFLEVHGSKLSLYAPLRWA